MVFHRRHCLLSYEGVDVKGLLKCVEEMASAVYRAEMRMEEINMPLMAVNDLAFANSSVTDEELANDVAELGFSVEKLLEAVQVVSRACASIKETAAMGVPLYSEKDCLQPIPESAVQQCRSTPKKEA